MEKLNSFVKRSLKKAPEGKLVLSTSNGVTQYYWKKEDSQIKGEYLDKKRTKLIKALAHKDYEERLIKELEKHIKRMKKIIGWIPEKGLEEVYEKLAPARQKLVKPYVLTDEQYIEQWMRVKYVGKQGYNNNYTIITERGECVRSKSEKIIADKLNSMGIPYRYEYPLELSGYGTVYPDFTLLDITNRKEIYLEHFGMMDNPEYCDGAIAKIQTYARYGLFPGKNFLFTFETSDRPLNTVFLEELLKEHFDILN